MGNYDPTIFTRVQTLAQAKAIILTQEEVLSPEQRWQLETPHVLELIANQFAINAGSLVVDYGCGVGRIARELIRKYACQVIGVDIAANMRALAASYVTSDRFVACAPAFLDELPIDADLVVAVWTLQHVQHPKIELDRIWRLLRSRRGSLFVINEGSSRFVPTDQGWINDGFDIRRELSIRFKPVADGNLDPDVVGLAQSERTFWSAHYAG